jgi:uncharacterized UPF0160 family protein
MLFIKKKKILVTHNNTFHADDIFAAAALSILEKGKVKIIRTRDPWIIKKGDYVFDVGGEYDGLFLFDHHQKGGAGARFNGIPYSSFGLIWKAYGQKICGNSEIAEMIDKRLVQPIDANDNGVDLFDLKDKLSPYLIQDLFFIFKPSWKEKQDYDQPFLELVSLAQKIILREIVKAKDVLETEKIIEKVYFEAKDKRFIILENNYPWGEIIDKYEEIFYVLTKKDNLWRVEGVKEKRGSFKIKKLFPEAWAGKRDEEMAIISGVSDAIFCHNGRFLVVAKSKEGAIKLAEKALSM